MVLQVITRIIVLMSPRMSRAQLLPALHWWPACHHLRQYTIDNTYLYYPETKKIYPYLHTLFLIFKRWGFIIKTRGSQTSNLQSYISLTLMLHPCRIDIIMVNQTVWPTPRTYNRTVPCFSLTLKQYSTVLSVFVLETAMHAHVCLNL
jgi:hypothetical protein